MLNYAPAIGEEVTFRFGEAKVRTWKGTVIEHVTDDWGDGFRVEWPTMRYAKKKGVTCRHSLPCPYLENGHAC